MATAHGGRRRRLPDGMEFSAFAFVSTTWFQRYDGQPNGFLDLITVHEIAHQWWYARVGSESALTPCWTKRFQPQRATVPRTVLSQPDHWWWEFRINSYAPTGFVDSSVYEFTTLREYINAIYLNGVRMLPSFASIWGGRVFSLLNKYAEAGDGEVVGSASVLGAVVAGAVGPHGAHPCPVPPPHGLLAIRFPSALSSFSDNRRDRIFPVRLSPSSALTHHTSLPFIHHCSPPFFRRTARLAV